ncbi:D-alanyl-D-alanine carboxypeptidase family protein [Nitrospirillum sp. BR 11828]|uniref:D-alanyl-D-alanine carboxypeptidase family protein n=1 Tax=Nitrospirillum sp. BR 11828 TaxID=3104325 RepID=UPI002ACA1C6D|nr:D-alanyl-D-alanine carboxypeptidase family protein [Nitrospirillum sp. BR 11828]MDZ5647946.1 D-alanyl-D-alanine carboxypeptidase family protein [Nitrospirillum sp. BR 11828]
MTHWNRSDRHRQSALAWRAVWRWATVALLACLAFAPGSAFAKYAAIVVDAETGQVLHAAGADTQNYPASLTKMMTLYLLFDALDAGRVTLDTPFKVSAHAAAQAPSKLGLDAGDTIRVRDAILALVTKSANDVAVTVGENLGGSEPRFAQMMTAKARALGMSRTTFRNASGLPNTGQVTTARDLARLAQALIHDHAKQYAYFKTASFTYNGETMANHNHLMARYPGMDGIKTGFINASGFNLVGSAVQDGRRLIAVVMGGSSAVWRDNRMADLLDEGFATKPGQVLTAEAPIRAPRDRGAVQLASAGDKAGDDNATSQGDEDEADEAPAPKAKASTVRLASAAGKAAKAVGKAAESVADHTLLAAPAEAAPAVATGAKGKSIPAGWSIQVGAYNDRAATQAAIARATQKSRGLLNAAVPNVVEVSSAKSTLYRARLAGLSEKTARAACAQLSRQGQGCITIAPGAN